METELSKILQSYENIEFALLFGSYASGNNNNLSDIDIAIYTKEPIDIFDQGEIIATLESRFEKKIDFLVLNDLYKSNAKLSFNIIDNHRIIFCKDMYDMFDNALRKRLNDGTYGKTKAS
jgi:predicted nucleotidyltransferase